MVDMKLLQSSDSSSSSNSSSGYDSSTSNESSRSFAESKSSKNAQEKTRSASVGGTAHAAKTNHVIPVETSLSQPKPSIVDTLSVNMVICIDSDSVKTPPRPSKTTILEGEFTSREHSPEPLPYQQEDDFPYFQEDDSLHSPRGKSPTLEQPQVEDLLGNGFRDEDLARLLDSPQVVERCNKTAAAAPETTKPSDSPDLSSICSDDLEIPRPDTPKKLREAASRFFQNTRTNEEKDLPRQQANNVPKAENASQIHDMSFAENSHYEEAQVLSPSEETSTRRPEEPVVVVDSRRERVSEVNPSLYQPPPYRQRPDPIVHHLSIHNRPKSMRQMIPVRELFSSPLSKLWLSKFDTFNHLQSEVANTLAHSDDSIVVSAPTGAGKTALFEIAMARFFAVDLAHNARYNNGQVSKQRKIVYVAPSKALCEERYEDWTRRLSDINVGIQCAMITGDAEPGDSFRDVAAAHVILTTPEKWDSLTRRWTENVFLFGTVKLLMLDEVHLLGDGTRGCCLEAIICRMKTIQRAATAASANYDAHCMSSYTHTSPEALSSFLRIVGVSATLPNVSSIAAFLEANESYAFDASYRPVPLTTHVVGCGFPGNNLFMFGKGLDNRVPDLIKRFSKGKSTIVFCHTKKEAETLAMKLSQDNGIGKRDDGRNMSLASQTHLASLQGPMLRGIAYHHAGLDASDRKLIEKAFVDGKLSVLCATSTLAMGVNLPAHLVIIKGTSAWRGQGHQDIDTGTLLQMMGRAGRPGFDDSGTAVIMTDNSSKTKYEQLSGGMEVVESHLPLRLMDVMNTEISQQVITSFEASLDWIKTTFFFRRAMENPAHYGLSSSESDIGTYFEKHCLEALQQLSDGEIITFNDLSGKISPLPACHIMSQHMVHFKSMSRIINLPYDANQSALLKLLAEFDGLHRPVRRAEKKPLKEVHKLIRYKLDGPPSKVTIKTSSEKAFVLLQAAIGQHYLEDFTMRQEMSYMVEFATRMLSAVEEYSSHGSLHGQIALQSLRLRRSLATSLWGASDGVLNQLRGVGHKTMAKLRFSRIISFVDVLSASSEDIERAAGRESPFGKQLRTSVTKILKNTLQLSACVESDGGVLKNIVCCLARRGAMAGMEQVESDESAAIVKYTLVVYTDRPGDCLLFQPNITGAGEYQLPCPPTCGKIFVHLVASMVGLDERLTLDGNAEIKECAYTTTKSGKKQTSASLLNESNDVRIKRGPSAKRKPTQQTLESSYAGSKKQRMSPAQIPSQKTANTQVARPPGTKAITPSPLPQRPSLQNTGRDAVFREQSPPKENRPPIRPSGSNVRMRGNRTSDWRQEKRSQKTLQQSAFRREKDNPFSRFQYDPNDIESSLVESSSKSTSPHPDEYSVIPSRQYAELKETQATSSTPRNAFRAGGGRSFNGASGSKGRSGGRSRGNLGRGSRKFPKMADRDLLTMKAMEQEEYLQYDQGDQYSAQARSQANPRMVVPRNKEHNVSEANFRLGGSYEPSASESIFPEGHPMRGDHRGFMQNSVYANSCDPWNSNGLVTQSQQRSFRHYMNDASSQLDYGHVHHAEEDINESYEDLYSQPLLSFQQHAFPEQRLYGGAGLWRSHSNARQDSPLQDQMFEEAFGQAYGAPQSMRMMRHDVNPSSYFTSQPFMSVPNEAVPDEEEDALFAAAFL